MGARDRRAAGKLLFSPRLSGISWWDVWCTQVTPAMEKKKSVKLALPGMVSLPILVAVKTSPAGLWPQAHLCLLFVLESLCGLSLTSLHLGPSAQGRGKPTLNGAHALGIESTAQAWLDGTEGERLLERKHELKTWGPAVIPTLLLRLGHSFPFPLNHSFFYWSLVDLQCCVSLRWIAKWFSYTYIHTYIHTYIYIYF